VINKPISAVSSSTPTFHLSWLIFNAKIFTQYIIFF
jgi:hypothetical protein